MADVIKLVSGDTGPQLKVTLTDEVTNAAINLTGATVKMYFRAVDTVEVLDTLIGTLINPTAGEVIFEWNPDTLDVDEAAYEGEVEVTFPSGMVQSVFLPINFFVREQFE